MSYFIPVILGTARQERRSEAAAQFVLEQVQRLPDIETMLVDVRDFRLPSTDDSEQQPAAQRYAKLVTEADSLIIVSPEYNHGYPGELKMLLDMAFDEYVGKPVGLCGVSSGGLGGARMVEQLRLVASTLGLVAIKNAMYFSNVKKLFDDQGHITDPKFTDKCQVFLDELLWYTEALHTQRNNRKMTWNS